jgi:TonB-linked SusC/RagA family outer membrane protein
LSGTLPRPRRRSQRLGAALGTAAATLPLLLMFGGGTAWAQRVRVSGTVAGPSGAPLAGVLVRVVGGGDSSTTTTSTGRYSISAPAAGTLTFNLIGFQPYQTALNGRTTVDVRLERLALLDQVVVTGYSGAQRRSEITGAVASVNIDATTRQTTASVLQRLDANVSGVTVANSGSPGARSTVRIRGISSFQNNDPLYVVDGVPVQDSYVNFLNPNDIASINVLKDASAASVYGSRASNGVIIIETVKQGTAGRPNTQFSLRTGMTTPVRGYDDFLIGNTRDYAEVIRRSYANAGVQVPREVTNLYGADLNNPQTPAYIWCGAAPPCTNVNLESYSYPNRLIMPGSAGTNWWNSVFGTGRVADANLSVTGGGTGASYAVSFNYFDQDGTAAYNNFRRGSVRVNTSFTRNKFTVGENISVTGERGVGGLGSDAVGEGGILGKNILSQPVVPVRDVAGNFASGKAPGLGNNTNPLKIAYEGRNNVALTGRVFGNVFANYDFTPRVQLRTSLGANAGLNSYNQFNPATPENSEATFNNSIFENNNRFNDFTVTNTLRYNRPGDRHNVSALLGQEAIRSTSRFLQGAIGNLINTNTDSRFLQASIGDAATINAFSNGGRSVLLSYFGKVDYTLNNRYTLSGTLRYDGSSRLGPDNRWGTFPAAGLSWRASEEAFLRDNRFFQDLLVRVGYGVTGNQQIPSGRIVSQFGGGRDQTFYDITGSNSTLLTGYRQVSLGNANLKWEENRSINAGFDVSLFNRNVNVIFDAFERVTDDLLFNPPLPGTAGTAAFPISNVGQMRNRGVDFSVGHRGASWSATFNGSHYRNKITRIDGNQTFFFGPVATRFGNQVINQIGSPIGAFFGYQADGIFRDAAEVAAHPAQDGKAPGRLRFRDTDGKPGITLGDRTVIGSPHPDFTAGLDLTANRGRWDLGATVFGTFGNDIFDAQKEFYVFRNFSTNVRQDLLTNSWTPENPNAKYPQLNVNDAFSRQLSSFYVEDGSYVRLRSLALGYTLPGTARYLPNGRLYVQAENIFTLTGYDGLDPALSASDITGAGGDIRDQYRGVDRGSYPSNRTFSVGVLTRF